MQFFQKIKKNKIYWKYYKATFYINIFELFNKLVFEEWNNLKHDLSYVKVLIKHYKKRLQAAIKNKGFNTKY